MKRVEGVGTGGGSSRARGFEHLYGTARDEAIHFGHVSEMLVARTRRAGVTSRLVDRSLVDLEIHPDFCEPCEELGSPTFRTMRADGPR